MPVNGVEDSDFRWHRLCGAIKYDSVDLDKLERPYQCEYGCTPSRNLDIRQLCAQRIVLPKGNSRQYR